MTEKQLEKLKQHLDVTNKQSPTLLDEAILAQAKVAAEKRQLEQTQEQEPTTNTSSGNKSWLSSLFQTTFAQSAFVSVVLTVSVFTALALLIKPQHQEPLVISETKNIEFDLVQKPSLGTSRSHENNSKNKRLQLSEYMAQVKMPETQQGRDQILAQMPLPDVQTLLDEMEFSAQQDRQLTKSLISLAMEDIRVMIDMKNLNEARVRYARLKDNCVSCPLPDSLEALLIVVSQGST